MKNYRGLTLAFYPSLLLLILAACTPNTTSPSTRTFTVPTTTPIPEIQISRVMTLLSRGVNDVAWLPDGVTVAIATAEGVYLHDAQSQAQLAFWQTDEPVTHLGVLPFDDYVFVGLASGLIEVYTLDGESIKSLYPPVAEHITAWTISPDASLLAVVYESQVAFWDIKEFSLRFVVQNPASQRMAGLHFLPDGVYAELLIFPSYECLMDIREELIVAESCDIYLLDGVSFSGYRYISSTMDGSLHTVIHRDGTVQLFELNEQNQQEEHLIMPGDDHGSGFGVALSADGEWLAASYDAGLLLYPLNNPDLSQTLAIRPHALAFSPDAQELIVGGPWATLRTFNLVTGEETLWPLYRGRLSAVAASIS